MDARRQYLISIATDVTAGMLQRRQLPFVLCGEMARAKYFGSTVPPSKVEILIISSDTILDEVKRSFILEQPVHFSLRKTNVLRFRDYSLPLGGQRNIDVELSLSTATGSLNRIPIINGFPVVPYQYLILRKLEEWDRVCHSQEPAFTNLEKVLSRDIMSLLQNYNPQRHSTPGGPFDPILRNASVERVARFSSTYTSSKHDWRRLGFSHFTFPDGTNTHPIPPPKAPAPTPKAQPNANVSPPPSATRPTTSTARLPATASSAPKPPPAVDKSKKWRPQVSRTQVRNLAAMAAVSILQNMNIRCAIFGSMGCRMFGNPRPPNDVDILLLPPPDDKSTQEDFKAAIATRDPVHFFLKDAKDPKATYKVLHYRMDNTSKKETSKVDILLPGVMHLPALSMEKIVWQRRGENVLPVVPFAVLLLQKLQGWDDHRTATENRYIKKAPVDVTDLTNMLQMRHVYPLVVSRPWSDRTLFSEEFEQRSRERVIDFCAQFPQHKGIWQRLGFETEEEDVLYTGILRLAI